MKVTHFLNKKIKPVDFSGELFYPLFVSISFKNKEAQVKSCINEHLKIYRSEIERITENEPERRKLISSGLFSQEFLDEISSKEIFPLYHLQLDEIHVIEKILAFKENQSKDIDLSDFNNDFIKHTTEITTILDERIKESYRQELRSIFMRSIDSDENKELFNITNYLIHYIDWKNSFWHFYEATSDLIPTELRTLENHLSNELRTKIRAFLAFHAKINVLKRFFEKRELGKISTLSYLDWKTHIKEFILTEFEKIFGEQKALQFIISLDSILDESISD